MEMMMMRLPSLKNEVYSIELKKKTKSYVIDMVLIFLHLDQYNGRLTHIKLNVSYIALSRPCI
jgi:hypothetical protein